LGRLDVSRKIKMADLTFPMNHKYIFTALLILHLLCGLICGYIAEDGPPMALLALYIGLFFSQTSLLGIWGGLAPYNWPIRLIVVTFGIAYLAPQFCFSLDEWDAEIFILVFLSTIVVAGVMLFVRKYFARLQRTSGAAISPNTEGLQFSIRHLMLLTLVISCTLAIGRLLQPHFRDVEQLTFILIISMCFVSVGLMSAWAMLGSHYVILRGFVVLVVSSMTAAIPAFLLGRGEPWLWTSMMFLEASFLLLSLFIVRQCGFRLVRISYEKMPSGPL